MSKVIIEKGVTMPEVRRRGRPANYEFGAMEIGDSFQVPIFYGKSRVNSVRQSTYRYMRFHPEQCFVVTKAIDGEWRCWRIS